MDVKELIEKIASKDDSVRGDAWQAAADAGPGAVAPLGRLMAEGEMEVARAAKRALWLIVRRAGRPGADAERAPAIAEVVALLAASPPVAREALWMLSEIARPGEAIRAISACLAKPEIRDDARMALERIPGDASLAALKEALASAPEDFKVNLAQSLRVRGVDVPGIPNVKLVPTRS
jgi:hypothetical protein